MRDVLNRVGDKWSIFVVSVLGDGPKRFSELKRTIEGVSQRMLTRTLRGLERDGLVLRTVFPTVPPSVSYQLTIAGQTLLEPVHALALWAEQHREEIQASRRRFDLNAAKHLAPVSPRAMKSLGNAGGGRRAVEF